MPGMRLMAVAAARVEGGDGAPVELLLWDLDYEARLGTADMKVALVSSYASWNGEGRRLESCGVR